MNIVGRHHVVKPSEFQKGKPISEYKEIWAWERAGGDVHTDMGVQFTKKDRKSRNLLDIFSSFEEYQRKMEQKGWSFWEPYGHGCQSNEIVVCFRSMK